MPVKLMASASGLVICTGEIFGGGIAPVIAGWLPGISASSTFCRRRPAAGGLAFGFVNSCFPRETAPPRLLWLFVLASSFLQ